MTDQGSYHATRWRTRLPGLIDAKALGGKPALTSQVVDLFADTNVWTDASKSTPAGDGDAVYTWADAYHDYQQSTASYRPILRSGIGGHWAIEFDGSDDDLSLSTAVVGSSSATVFIVVYLSSTSEHGAFWGVGSGSNGWKVGVGGSDFNSNGNGLIILFDEVKWIRTGDAIGTGKHLVTVRLTGGAPEWWIDGVPSGSTTGSPRSPSALTSIGSDARFGGRFYTDYLLAVVAGAASVSDSEVTAMNNYLMGRYGI